MYHTIKPVYQLSHEKVFHGQMGYTLFQVWEKSPSMYVPNPPLSQFSNKQS